MQQRQEKPHLQEEPLSGLIWGGGGTDKHEGQKGGEERCDTCKYSTDNTDRYSDLDAKSMGVGGQRAATELVS